MFSLMMGASPPQLVNVVKKIGLKRCIPADLTASFTGGIFHRHLLTPKNKSLTTAAAVIRLF